MDSSMKNEKPINLADGVAGIGANAVCGQRPRTVLEEIDAQIGDSNRTIADLIKKRDEAIKRGISHWPVDELRSFAYPFAATF